MTCVFLSDDIFQSFQIWFVHNKRSKKIAVIVYDHICWRGEVYRGFGGKSEGKSHLRDPRVHGRIIRVGADKSLTRPGRKQATANKFRICVTCTLRSTIHFLQASKKYQNIVRLTRTPRQQWLPRRTKNVDLSISFTVQGTDSSPRGQIRRIGWVIKPMEDQICQFFWVAIAR